MPRKRSRIAETIETVDNTGQRFTIQKIVMEEECTTLSSTHEEWEEVQSLYRLPNGQPVNVHPDGGFEVLATGKRLRRR